MITVEYRGGIGNQMFQYAFGRLLAEMLGYEFQAPAIDIFPGLVRHITGRRIENGTITFEQNSKHQVILHDKEIAARADGFAIHLKAYFEFSYHFIVYRKLIRTWFQFCSGPTVKDRVAIHVRGGDAEPWRNPPDSYYKQAIQTMSCEKDATIFTDEESNPFVRHLSTSYPVVSSMAKEDFASIASHDRIIIGNSTFAWWAAFLSNASEIIQPEPMNGWRSLEYPNSFLRVPDWRSIRYANT